MKVAVLGGGASGMACAIRLKQLAPQISVTIYEKNDAPGKKILATGNGRCNLSNEVQDLSCYYGDGELLKTVLDLSKDAMKTSFSAEECRHFFRSLGLFTTVEEGRIYPRTMTAASVKEVLVGALKQLGVTIKTQYTVTSITAVKDGFQINGTDEADKVVLALGGKAGPQYGTDGDAYRLLKQLGILYQPITPALTALKVKENIKDLHGVRVRGSISLLHEDGTLVRREEGELQLTDYGVSGIAAMQLSSPAAVFCKTEEPRLLLDFFPEESYELLAEMLLAEIELHPANTLFQTLSGLLHQKLILHICNGLSLSPETPISNLSLEQLSGLIAQIKQFPLTVTGTKSYKDAQTTHGGVGADQFLPGSLESTKVEGLFITGELLHVDGICGGYNLHFAWASGQKAAEEIAEQFYAKENRTC